MQSRKLHALLSCTLFVLAALVFGHLAGQPLDPWRLAFWSLVGVGSYVILSQLFGFDPHRSRLARFAPALAHYIDRWEFRHGQATLSMLAVVVVAAGLLDPEHFMGAVLTGTLAACTYFIVRLYAGGYSTPERVGGRR